MLKPLPLLLSLYFLLATALLTQNSWPSLFSHQDPVDPAHLVDNFDSNPPLAYFNNQSLSAPKSIPQEIRQILGETSSSSKRIEVDLTNQKAMAFENNNLINEFTISSGKWDRTPNGTFYIWSKIRSQKMSGGSRELGTYYYLPNVPYIMFFYNDKTPKRMGYSLHGTYWHNNFGTPMSHGCINMKTPDAATLFSWAEIDTPIVIYGKFQYQSKKPLQSKPVSFIF